MTPFETRVEATLARPGPWTGRSPRYALAAAPVASPVHRGVASDCVRVEADGLAPIFLKIRHADMAGDVLPHAAEAARRAAGLGVAPEILVAEDGLLGMTFLPEPWRYARVGDLQNRDVMRNVIAAKKRLHDGQPLGRRFCPFTRIANLAQEAQTVGAALPEGTDGLVAQAGKIRTALEAAGFDLRFCHNDGIASNIMLGEGGAVQLVDFDFAGDNDPWFDIGALMNEACNFDVDRHEIVEFYAGRHDSRLTNRCRLYSAVDDVMGGLWGVVRAATSRRAGIEFYKYGLWRLFHARTTMSAWDFEAWLRDL